MFLIKKYKLGQVGIKRHPEIYAAEQKKVFKTVEEELAMWKAAEKMHKISKDFTDKQFMFVMHYTMCLRGLNDWDIISLHDFMKMKTIESNVRQSVFSLLDCSAEQIAKKLINKK